MGLYGYIEHDGRVIRSIKSLSTNHQVILYAHCKSKDFQLANARILKRETSYYLERPYLEQILFLISFFIKVIKIRPDLVYLHDYYLTFAGKLIRLFTSSKVVYDAHELVILETGEEVTFRMKLFAFMERIAIKSFDFIIAANDERARIMKEYYDLPVIPTVVRNIPDIEISNDLYSKLQLEDKFEILKNSNASIYVYQGVITPIRQIDKLVGEVAKIENSLVLIVGGGSESYIEKLKNGFYSVGLENVHFLGKVDLKTLYSILNISDFGLISYSDANLNNKYCAPNKLYEYAQFNLPMITTGQEIFQATFSKYKIGLVYNGHKSDFLTDLLKVSSNQNISNEFEKFNKAYNQRSESIKLNEVISTLVNNYHG